MSNLYKKIEEYQVKTFEEACQISGICPRDVKVNLPYLSEGDKIKQEAYLQLKIVANVANCLEHPHVDYRQLLESDNFQLNVYHPDGFQRWEPTFSVNEDNVFRFDSSIDWSCEMFIGSTIYYTSMELSDYIGIQFLDIYKNLFSTKSKTPKNK